MSCPTRMYFVLFIILSWTLCGDGTSGSGGNLKGENDTSISPISVADTHEDEALQNQTFSKKIESQLGRGSTVGLEEERLGPSPLGNVKTTPRSKLWSPYSTIVSAVEENEEDIRDERREEEDERATFSEKASSGKSGGKKKKNEEVESSPKLPIISSIRHYRSRKSFVRTTKPPPNNKFQSNPSAKGSHVDVADSEEGEEQKDQPFTHASPTIPESKPTQSFGKLVLGKSTKNRGQGEISRETDGGQVYGTPYFIPGATRDGKNASAPGKIDKARRQKQAFSNTFRNSSATNYNVIKNKSSQKPVSQLKSLTGEGRSQDGGQSSRKRNKVSSKGNSTTIADEENGQKGKEKEKGGRRGNKDGKKVKEKKGRKQQNADQNLVPNNELSGISPKSSRSRTTTTGGESDQDQRKSKARQGKTPLLLNPKIRDKSDYPRNYNAHSNDQLRQGPEMYEPHDHDPSEDFEGDGVVHVADYFPQSHGAYEDGNNGEEVFEEDTPGSGNFYTDEYESLDPTSNMDSSSSGFPQYEGPDTDIMTVFLRIVESQHTLGANCSRGTDVNLGEGVVDHYAQERFRLESELTVNRANMLTRFWKYADPKTLEDEYILHAMVISLVEFDEDIFAAGNCYDENQYKNYTLFCPYGYRDEKEGTILVKDLSLEYPYLSNTSEWFYKARKDADRIIKNFNQFSRGSHSFRKNESSLVEEEILNVTYEDGKWSKPYFDCGGGNIWMITYMVPFFGYNNGTYYFKGTSGIDIDLRRVDIDQCPLPKNSTELNIFAASDKCKKSTTKCVPIKGLGFRRGSYKCECKMGFYFPNITSTFKYFNGTLLEEEYEKKFTGNTSTGTSLYDAEGVFECLPCSPGCDMGCVDDRPCVVSLNWLMRTAILILQSAIIATLPIVGLFTWKYSNVKVVRAASPVLLRFIVLGAFSIYCTILVMYPSPNIITCTIRVWLREIGFSLAYGALMLKTWRISVIFRVRSAKAIKITDLNLMKRLGIIVSVVFALLVIRTLVAPPVAIVSYTADELKAYLCKSDWWDHTFTFMELTFLVWGIRLCIVVRKAPSEFNESKFISLAIYNEFLLSLFLNISMLFLQSPANPDLLYIIFFCHVQLTMTLLLCLIFGSKAYIVFRGQGKGGSDESRVPTSKFISKSRSGHTTKQTSAHNSTPFQSSTTSTGHDPNLNPKLSEDVQEEFRRLYFQLEELKERNLRQGNRHLVAKITAMQEAADNIFSTSAQVNGQSMGSPSKGKVGKSKLLSDISEEENPSQSPRPGATGNRDEGDKTSFFPGNVECEGDHRSDGQEAEGKKGTAKKKDKVQFQQLELQDTNLDEVESDNDNDEEKGEKRGVTFDLGSPQEEDEQQTDGKPDCINEDASEAENIPMQALRRRKQPPSSEETPNNSNPQTDPKEIGKGTKDAEKSQNHAGTKKLVLDLDDKSRFTEEITV